jgi:hypothetical protein
MGKSNASSRRRRASSVAVGLFLVVVPTPPRAAADECLKVDTNAATFAAVRANTITPAEAVPFAFDGDIHTKWVDYKGAGSASWATITLSSAAAVTTYGLVSGNDAPERDPATWTLSGSASADGSQWVVLDTQVGVAFMARQQRRAFAVNAAAVAFIRYRLDVTAVAGGNATALVQLAELELWAGDACHDPCCGVDCSGHGACDGSTGTCRSVPCVSVPGTRCTRVAAAARGGAGGGDEARWRRRGTTYVLATFFSHVPRPAFPVSRSPLPFPLPSRRAVAFANVRFPSHHATR